MINFFITFSSLLQASWSFLGSTPFLLCAVTISLVLKTVLLFLFVRRGIRTVKLSIPFILLLLILTGGMLQDTAWLVRLTRILFAGNISKIPSFIVRMAWAFFVVYYQAMIMFVENLAQKNFRLKLHQLPFLVISAVFFCFFAISAFFRFNNPTMSPLEHRMMESTDFYLLTLLVPIGLLIAIWQLRSTKAPKIVKHQIKTLIKYFIVPVFIADFIQIYPFYSLPSLLTYHQSVVGISSIALTCTIYYSARKVINLRLLNLDGHVRSPKDFGFMEDFKNVLAQFSHVTNERELILITQHFFNKAFNIPLHKTHLHIRTTNNTQKTVESSDRTIIETFISTHSQLLVKQKIMVTDELAFSNFYEQHDDRKHLLTFLASINADIFIPVHNKETIVAYIIVKQHARTENQSKHGEFYNNVECDHMAIFTTNLGNMIHLLRSRNVKKLMAEKKELREELHSKLLMINQYQESIRSFLHIGKEKKIGIMFYKNRYFTFGNQEAQQLIPVNVNLHAGHPITKTLKKIVQQTLTFKSPQKSIEHDNKGNKLVLSAIPLPDKNSTIILIYYPDIADTLKKKIELLHDSTKWDYLMYLETTQNGKLVDQLIPGGGEIVVNFKTELLKIALSKKAILLDMPQDDLMPTVELLHHISMRDTLHVLSLQGPSVTSDVAVKLFGINPLFAATEEQQGYEKPLLEKLDTTGTLFIKNIHFLDLKNQESLAEFLHYGSYRLFKSDQKAISNVRIICSTSKNLLQMVSKGTFSKALFNELNKTSLVMPSLMTLPEEELNDLAIGFSEQAIKTDTFKNLLELTDKEKNKLARAKPASLKELKTKVQQLLIKKSEKSEIQEEIMFDPAYNITDPELAEAARLGKHALRSKHVMELLWKKFENQNKIAQFLGVNRSSIHKRCKEYNLVPSEQQKK